MPKMRIPKTRPEMRQRRHLRVRKKVTGTGERPRLVVFRSLKHIYAQLVDDVANRTLMTVSDQKVAEGKKTERSAPRSAYRHGLARSFLWNRRSQHAWASPCCQLFSAYYIQRA